MANLFFIHTPLQLMIAQMIIEQEKMTNNVMLCGYVDDNRQFLQLYDLIRIEDMWKAIEPMDDVARWAMFSRKKLLSGTYKVLLRYRYICRVVKKHKIGTLFLGDMKNGSCQLAAMTFHRKGLKICFFEEGAGHYIHNYDYGNEGTLWDKMYSSMIDFFYYRPFFGSSFAFFKYKKGSRLEFLPMDVRYSIVPFYHESFDKLITCKMQVPDKIKKQIETELVGAHMDGNVLMLTSPFYILHGDDDDPSLYIRTIVDTLCRIKNNVHVWLKFHPREKKNVADEVCRQLDSNGVKYQVLGKEMSLPVEYYLQLLHFDVVYMFLCSSSVYNGYLFPKTKFTSILRPFYELCKAENSELAWYLGSVINNNSISLNE